MEIWEKDLYSSLGVPETWSLTQALPLTFHEALFYSPVKWGTSMCPSHSTWLLWLTYQGNVKGTQGLEAVWVGWLLRQLPTLTFYITDAFPKGFKKLKSLYKWNGLLRAGRCDTSRHIEAQDITLWFSASFAFCKMLEKPGACFSLPRAWNW